MAVKLVWATPNIDAQIGYIARVSNPSNQDNPNVSGLLNYMITHGHWSPFEMANVCVEIETTRDIARQILRHRSFSFQEFSQRYAEANRDPVFREARMQDSKNRQNSLDCDNEYLAAEWKAQQEEVAALAAKSYGWAIQSGIAKEVARTILPEGMTMSKMYMNGTIRSWIHYLDQRLDPATQKEHREIAEQIRNVLLEVAPITIGKTVSM